MKSHNQEKMGLHYSGILIQDEVSDGIVTRGGFRCRSHGNRLSWTFVAVVVEKQMFPLLVLTAMEWEVKGLTK